MTLTLPRRLHNGVIMIDAPCIPNAHRVDQGCVPMIVRMNQTGVLLDPERLAKVHAKAITQCDELLDKIRTHAGDPGFTPTADKLAVLLYQDLKLEPRGGIRRTKSGSRASTDDDALNSLTGQHPVVDDIKAWRQVDKIRTTYTRTLPLHRHADGRVRTTFGMVTARTGRLDSKDPNLQNIPVRTKLGAEIRTAFTASPGYRLVGADLSQIEMVWAAHLSGDRTMIEVFHKGEDMHVRTAHGVFSDPATGLLTLSDGQWAYPRLRAEWARYKAKDPALDPGAQSALRKFELEYRLPSKTLGFAVLFGTTAEGLQTQIVAAGGPYLPTATCQQYIDRWMGVYHGVRVWMGTQWDRAVRMRMVWTAFGRIRYIPEAQSAIRRIRAQGLRQAGNTPIQGSAGDLLKLIMAVVWSMLEDWWSRYGPDCVRPVLTIHDELIFEVLDIAGMPEEWAETVKVLMENTVDLLVPVGSSVSIADDWGGLK